MRLIKLRVRNIASLKGEHLINFAEIQNASPLFAITGETGAGKSTLLNAIGLVLYGKVYKSGVGQLDLVSLGEKEGQIELIFQAQGKNYLALWKVRVRKQNGELYSTPPVPQRELYTLEGVEFESPKNILMTRIEELLNLDFDQFCKCIILNQGEFARFLSSSFTERKDILEKLYPGEMFDKVSAKLKEEKNQLEKQISDLDIELHALKGDGPQGEDLTLLKTKLEADYKMHESWLNQLEATSMHFSSLHTYHTKYAETNSRIMLLKTGMAQETSVFNELLVQSQMASEELTQIQKLQDKELPRLQELLKAEESLKLYLEQKLESEKNKTKYNEQFVALEARLLQTKSKIHNWQERSQEIIKSFILSLDELKKHSKNFEIIFELYTKLELLNQELVAKEERLAQLEVQGKDEAKELKDLTNKKTSLAENKKIVQELEVKKKELLTLTEIRQRAMLRIEELQTKEKELTKERDLLAQKTITDAQELHQLQQEHLPLETSIKLQNLLHAVEVCLTHPALEETGTCPVCQTRLKDDDIRILKRNLQKTDFTQIKTKEAQLIRLILKKENEISQLKDKEEASLNEANKIHLELKNHYETVKQPIASVIEIEYALADAQKNLWEQEKLLKDEERLMATLAKTREQYLMLKNEISSKSAIIETQQQTLNSLLQPLSFISELNAQSIIILKAENRKLQLHLELETQGLQLNQELTYLNESTTEVKGNASQNQTILNDLNNRIDTLEETLTKELEGKKASDLILGLTQKVKEKADYLTTKERDLKSQELKLKESQSRLYTLEELIKEIDLQFTRETHNIRELAKTNLSLMNADLTNLINKLRNLALELSSSEALFIPLKELIESQKSSFKEKTSELKMNFASVRARLEDWEKRQDRIALLLLKTKDLQDHLDRRSRLYEVLGKDELRTFVLSLVEENLITQTNDELQKLCQGRYEIVHQSRGSKLTPEFYILDKFREGGLRKVSTLSGGETLMVSLAMALGLAEMTRGKAEIDSLFIDEGFGTLDQDSLEDVLDMLKQIQNRGLMVGIISHVKALTNALPVNLVVTKRNDGTSTTGLQYN